MDVKYSEKQINWLMDNYTIYHSYSDIAKDFNTVFKTNKTESAIRQKMTKGLKLYLITEKNAQHYTNEQEDWLKNNYIKFNSYAELTYEFNYVFKRNKPIEAIREKCNKYLRLSGIPNPTSYKKGNIRCQLPIGTIKKTGYGTYIKVKDSVLSYMSGYQEPYWIPLQKKIWIDHYGEVPKGKMVIFLDGNRNNFDIDNLYCIDRKISAVMASNKWYTNSREHTLTAIKWCELYYETKEKSGSLNKQIL